MEVDEQQVREEREAASVADQAFALTALIIGRTEGVRLLPEARVSRVDQLIQKHQAADKADLVAELEQLENPNPKYTPAELSNKLADELPQVRFSIISEIAVRSADFESPGVAQAAATELSPLVRKLIWRSFLRSLSIESDTDSK